MQYLRQLTSEDTFQEGDLKVCTPYAQEAFLSKITALNRRDRVWNGYWIADSIAFRPVQCDPWMPMSTPPTEEDFAANPQHRIEVLWPDGSCGHWTRDCRGNFVDDQSIAWRRCTPPQAETNLSGGEQPKAPAEIPESRPQGLTEVSKAGSEGSASPAQKSNKGGDAPCRKNITSPVTSESAPTVQPLGAVTGLSRRALIALIEQGHDSLSDMASRASQLERELDESKTKIVQNEQCIDELEMAASSINRDNIRLERELAEAKEALEDRESALELSKNNYRVVHDRLEDANAQIDAWIKPQRWHSYATDPPKDHGEQVLFRWKDGICACGWPGYIENEQDRPSHWMPLPPIPETKPDCTCDIDTVCRVHGGPPPKPDLDEAAFMAWVNEPNAPDMPHDAIERHRVVWNAALAHARKEK